MQLKAKIKQIETQLSINPEFCHCSKKDFIEIQYPDDQGNNFVYQEFDNCRNCGGKENPAFRAAYHEGLLKVYWNQIV
jgi:hypothetical protein